MAVPAHDARQPPAHLPANVLFGSVPYACYTVNGSPNAHLTKSRAAFIPFAARLARLSARHANSKITNRRYGSETACRALYARLSWSALLESLITWRAAQNYEAARSAINPMNQNDSLSCWCNVSATQHSRSRGIKPLPRALLSAVRVTKRPAKLEVRRALFSTRPVAGSARQRRSAWSPRSGHQTMFASHASAMIVRHPLEDEGESQGTRRAD